MVAEEMARSFDKKNNNYSHCPLKKRPVTVLLSEDVTVVKKEKITDFIVDDMSEPENLSTKPEDLSKKSSKRLRSPSPAQRMHEPLCGLQAIQPESPRSSSPIMHCSSSPVHCASYFHRHQQQHSHYSPPRADTSPVVPVHPMAKKARVEVIQHDNGISQSVPVDPSQMHFMVAKMPLEPLNLNAPVEPVHQYASWRNSPLYASPHYFSYPSAYRYHPADVYPSYALPAYPHSPPEHQSVSPSPPHSALTCSTIQRPIPRSYAHWTSPDHCGLSPTSSLGSGSLQSPPPVTPEDLSSPGSESGRSSAGSISVGSTVVKMEKSPESPTFANSSSATRYQCPDCGKSYSTYSGLSKHQQYHCAAAEGQAKKSFTCKFCEKVYVSLGALKMHIRTHTLPCKCHLCGKAFSRPWLLQGHIRTHTGEKPFSCQHCNRAFADRSNLRAHLQTHSDVKKYSCTSCSKTFSRMSLLTKHQEGGCPGVTVPMGYGC